MVTGRSQVAQLIYLAQLHAAKGSCKCKVCSLMRKTVDAMTEEIENPTKADPTSVPDAIAVLRAAGYDVDKLMIPEVRE